MNRKVAIASTIWGASILLSRVIGLVREAVIGRTLGISSSGDVYATAFVIPDFLNYLLAGGALSIVFIPIFGAYLARGEEERGYEAFSVIATFLCVLLGALVAIAYVALPWLVPIVAPGFDEAERADLVALTRIVLPAQIFHVVGGLLSAALQARDRHALAALAPLVYTLCIVAGGWIGGPALGPYGFAWGVLAGSVLGPFLLPMIGCMRHGLRFRPRFEPFHPDLKKYLVRSLPIMLGFSIVVVDDWFLRREGSQLGAGAVSTLTYAKSLMRVPMGVFGLAAGVAAYPTMARLVAEDRASEMFAKLASTLRSVVILAFAAQALFSVCGFEIAAIVYGRRRIGESQLHELATCLALVSIGLCAWSVQPLLSRGFYALGNTWLPALLGTVVAAACYPFYALARATGGVQGLAFVSSGAIVVYVSMLALILRRRLPARARNERPTFASFLTRAIVALGVSIALGRTLGGLLPGSDGPTWTALRAVVCGTATLAAFAVVAGALGLIRWSLLVEKLRRRLAFSGS